MPERSAFHESSLSEREVIPAIIADPRNGRTGSLYIRATGMQIMNDNVPIKRIVPKILIIRMG